MGDMTEVNHHRPAAVARRSPRELARARLLDLLGDLPTESEPPSARLVNREERKLYTLDRLVLRLNGIEEVPAFFISPSVRGGVSAPGKRPALLYFHSHGHHYDLGKRELTDGVEYMANPPYAEVCGQLGICALVIDQWGFGERHRETESELFKRFLWEGRLLWGMMIYDSLRALDYLAARDDIDSARIASLGMSMGSTLSWWTAALDERIAFCVDLCCLTDYQSLIAEGGLDLHGLYYYVPRLLKYFTTSSINALIAPRPHLSLQGDNDALTPRAGIDAVDAELKRVYETEKAPANWSLHRFPCGHQELPEMRKIIVDRLAAWATR
ncbi:MAG TPA: alpha/beta hydrolase [Spirochaetia bacterium]|nr:alpha/beta hydrolase [Spirochaetia bacterium]